MLCLRRGLIFLLSLQVRKQQAMTSIQKNKIKYYRACLLDGIKGKVRNPLTFESEGKCLQSIPTDVVDKIWQKGVKSKESSDTDEFNIVSVSPFPQPSGHFHFEHAGQTDKFSDVFFPFWIPFYVDKEGNLYPPKDEELPYFVREYLAPTTKDVPTIGNLSDYDTALQKCKISYENLADYWASACHFFNCVSSDTFTLFSESKTYFGITPYEPRQNMIKNILDVYNRLESSRNLPSVLSQILSTDNNIAKNTISEENVFLNNRHFGQMNGEFPLSFSQRVAFAAYTSDYAKNIFAINGPPGTGKTTILQSIVANALVRDVLADREPSLIVGCSTNNQAITNILDSMQMSNPNDPLASRWIEDVESFGTYLTSDASKNTKYQIETSNRLNTGFFEKIDTASNVESFKEYYTQKFNAYIQNEGHALKEFDTIKHFLKKRISDLQTSIENFIRITKRRLQINDILHKQGYRNEEEMMAALEELTIIERKDSHFISGVNEIKDKLERKYNTFPFYYKWFTFIPSIRETLSNSFKLIAQPILKELGSIQNFHNYHELCGVIDKLLFDLVAERLTLQNKISSLQTLKENIFAIKEEYEKTIDEWDSLYGEKITYLRQKTGTEYSDLPFAEDCAIRLDISYRYELFWNAVHLREWEYIVQLATLKDRNPERGKDSYRKKLQRISKVTPLFISTFHTLPKFATYYSRDGEMLYKELFDLMIVDECGQVTPEVGIPSLSFTKKVVAVGDVCQIEPVWGISLGIDLNNAKKYKLVQTEDDFDAFSSAGFACSSGSLMHLIRNKTPFVYKHKNGDEERGTYLLEHRRCLDDIAYFSAKYVYKGALKLMVGNKHSKNHDLPPIGYVHVRGVSEQENGSSRRNIKEAKAVVEWISLNKTTLEKAYGKHLSDILAVVTPFFAQKNIILKLLQQRFGGELKSLTVGTVHTLQGAERPIILFSATNDTKDKSLFIDFEGKYNMLNVAITRAKHSFIVFGNMQIFSVHRGTPSGNLAKILFSKKEYEIDNTFLFDTDILYETTSDITRIAALELHVKALKRCFETAEKELIIFSPFISYNALQSDDILPLVHSTVQRGVKVIVITDKYLDKTDANGLKQHSQKGREALVQQGVDLVIADGIHNKTILVDDKVLIEGSFNWLSATRDKTSRYFREESSIIITDKDCIQESSVELKKILDKHKGRM